MGILVGDSQLGLCRSARLGWVLRLWGAGQRGRPQQWGGCENLAGGARCGQP